MNKSTQPLKEKIYSLNQGLSCGLTNSQVNNAKASTLSQGNSPQNLRKERKDKQEKLKQEKAKPKLEKRYDKTLKKK